MPKTTYQTDYKWPASVPHRPVTSHGTLAKEGITPAASPAAQRGIGGTRFLSDEDIKLAALARRLGVNPFPDKSYTPKEERLVQGVGYRLGMLYQAGGFLTGRRKCVLKKGEKFEQHPVKQDDIKALIDNGKVTYASLWGGAGTITKNPQLRVDIQSSTAAQQNLQIQANIQRNGGSTTASAIFINSNLAKFEQKSHQTSIVKQTKRAFLLSAKTGYRYEVMLGAEQKQEPFNKKYKK